jgi:predicted GIY-YIG superfamily endonuclease
MMNVSQLSSDKVVCGVYAILSPVTGEVYIGSSGDCYHRLHSHKSAISFRKSRVSEFNDIVRISATLRFVVLEECHKDELLEKEKEWVDAYRELGACLVLNKRNPDVRAAIYSEHPVTKVRKYYDSCTDAEVDGFSNKNVSSASLGRRHGGHKYKGLNWYRQ